MYGSLQHHLFQDTLTSDFRQEHCWLITLEELKWLGSGWTPKPFELTQQHYLSLFFIWCMIWKGKSEGTFSLKSCYSISTQVSSQNTLWPWKSIWKGMAPLKIKSQMFLLVSAQSDTPQRRGNVAMWIWRGQIHRFHYCKFTEIWNVILNIFGIFGVPKTTLQFFPGWRRRVWKSDVFKHNQKNKLEYQVRK